MAKRWLFKGNDLTAIEQIAATANVDTVIAQLLWSRGILKPSDIQFFLEAKFSDLRDPTLLPGLDSAAARVYQAIKSGTPITIYGDYDADGMTGTAILFSCLRLLGADVNYHVPNRLEDSYGLSCESLSRLAQHGRKMIISVDCGIGSVAEAAHCRTLGIELIITDHHRMGECLPDSDAIVHPALPGHDYPFHGLCGAGVAFKLAWALCQLDCASTRVSERHRSYLLGAMTLAAIGTVADVVPLLDENRILVRHALALMTRSAPLGLAALLKQTNLSSKSTLSAEDIAFTIAPRLNAAGRLGQAQLGVELLTTQDPSRAAVLAEYIDRLNGDRESIERSMILAASKQAKEQFDIDNDSALVLAGPGWHLGVIGVVAGRLAEKFYRPVVIIGMDSTGQKPATGSARSQGLVDLHAAFTACKHHLVSCGGHAAAAGLRIEEKNIGAFREAFCEYVAAQQQNKTPIATLEIDAETTLKQLNLNTVLTIERLAPFGAGNPRPVLVASGVQLHEPAKTIGAGERHLSLRFNQHGTIMRGVAFSQPEWLDPINTHNGHFDIAFRPSINEFNGMKRVEFQLLDWRVSKTAPKSPHVASDKAVVLDERVRN